jgi:tRNA pseudouridine13 synthase
LKLNYLSRTPGIGGTIKTSADDFVVEEISEEGQVYQLDTSLSIESESGKFVHFILQKKDWSTSSAISEIAKRLHVGPKRFNTAGIKDKIAHTTQLSSAYGLTKDQILNLNIKDIKINGAWLAKDKVRIGSLLGNRFTIKVADSSSDQTIIDKINYELNGVFPNYFGDQRFGSSRRNTHIVGHKILLGKFDEAVAHYLFDTEGEQNQAAVNARKNLSETKNYSLALKEFPKYLRLERTIIAYLNSTPSDYLGALRKLPRNILLLFVHAFQSYMFNYFLSQRLNSGNLELGIGEYYCSDHLGFPDASKPSDSGIIAAKLIGYDSPLSKEEEELLSSFDLTKDNFRNKSVPELSLKGSYRPLFCPLKDFSFNKESSTFRFCLPSGAYATVALREFIDNKNEE